MRSTVNLSKSAIFELIMAALEAYAIEHENKSEVAIETFAHLWGSCNKRQPFKCNVEHVSVETSAKRTQDSVQNKLSSLDLKKDIASIFGNGYQHLGTFHTHPWIRGSKSGYAESADTIRSSKLFNFSSADHKAEIGSPTVQVGKNNFSVALVITILATQRANDRKDGLVDFDLYEFSMGNIKMWLKAQVFQHIEKKNMGAEHIKAFEQYNLNVNNYSDTDILPIPIKTSLDCDFMGNLCYHLKGFGRISFDENEKCFYHTKEVAEKREYYSI